MIFAALQFTGLLAVLVLAGLWTAAMVVICKDAFAPQPMLAGRLSSGPAREAAPVISLAERIQARVESRGPAPWRVTTAA